MSKLPICVPTAKQLILKEKCHFFIDLLSALSGATKSLYAPEPFDVGRKLQADITADGQIIRVATTGPIDPGFASTFKL